MLAGALFALSACAVEAQSNYSVTFPVGAKADNTMAYLVDWDSAQKMDSAIVTNGTVRFEGNVDAPMIGRIMLGGKRGPVFFIESGNVIINEKGESSGTPLNDKMVEYRGKMSVLANEFKSLDQNDSVQAVRAKEIYAQYQAMPAEAYAANKDNLFGLYMYMQGAYELPLAQVESDMAQNKLLGSSKQLQALHKTLKVQSETGEGKHYKDFVVEYNGKKESLSDYVKPGQVTIVDFWASWCGPCVRQLKVLKELYAKYKDKGLNVVGVAVWDKPEDTEKAIKSHELPWPCIVNAQTIPTDLYGIQGIPCIIVINPEGIIVSRDKQSEALVKDVDTAMASYKPVADAAPARTEAADTLAAF